MSTRRADSRVRTTLSRAFRVAFASLASLGSVLAVAEDGQAAEFATLAVAVDAPDPLSFDDTVVGRARHSVRIEVTNPSASTVRLADYDFRFVPIKDGITYSCRTIEGEADRWPDTIAPGAKLVAKRSMTCETPMVGRYDVQVRVHRVDPRGGERASRDAGAASADRIVASFPLVIEKGTNPPKQVPWNAALLAAASSTRDMRPADPPPRVIVALVNQSRENVSLTPAKVTVHVKRRGGTDAPCEDQVADLAFEGTLKPGEVKSLPTVLRCSFKNEGIYELVTTLSDGSARVQVAELALRVSFIPTPVPMYRSSGPLRPDPHP